MQKPQYNLKSIYFFSAVALQDDVSNESELNADCERTFKMEKIHCIDIHNEKNAS